MKSTNRHHERRRVRGWKWSTHHFHTRDYFSDYGKLSKRKWTRKFGGIRKRHIRKLHRKIHAFFKGIKKSGNNCPISTRNKLLMWIQWGHSYQTYDQIGESYGLKNETTVDKYLQEVTYAILKSFEKDKEIVYSNRKDKRRR